MSSLTKILVVLQLVFALVLAVLVVFGISHIDNYRSQVKAANDGMSAAQVALAKSQTESLAKDAAVAEAQSKANSAGQQWEKKNLDLQEKLTQTDIARATAEAKAAALVDSITRLTATADSLQQVNKAKDDEIAKIQPENVSLTQKNADLNRALNEATTANRFHEIAIKKLQEQLAAAPETKTGAINPAAAGNDEQVKNLSAAPSNGPINGKITDSRTASGRTLVELSLGERDGVQVNSRFTIYRGSSYVGDAVVESVTPDKSVAAVTVLKPGQTVHNGDMVLSNNGQ